MVNIVQTLNENTAGKRGRPRSRENMEFAALYPELHGRTSIYNRRRSCRLMVLAIERGLVDGDIRDKTTGRRMMTKFVELSRLFADDFWGSEEGGVWLVRNWSELSAMTVEELRLWVREHNSRARMCVEAG